MEGEGRKKNNNKNKKARIRRKGLLLIQTETRLCTFPSRQVISRVAKCEGDTFLFFLSFRLLCIRYETVIRSIRAREPVQQDSFAKWPKLIENPAKGSNSPSRKRFEARISPRRDWRRNRDEGSRVVLREAPVYIFQNTSAWLDDCQRA